MSNKSLHDHLQEFLRNEIPYRAENQFEIPKDKIPEGFVQDCLERIDMTGHILVGDSELDMIIENMIETYELLPADSELEED